MKKALASVIVSVVMFSFNAEAQVSKTFRYGQVQDYVATIRLLNGIECRDARVTVDIRRASSKPHCDAFEVKFQLDGGDTYKMGWHDGGGAIFESFVCARRAGMGTIRVFFGFDEVLFAEYRAEGQDGYVRFFPTGGRRKH